MNMIGITVHTVLSVPYPFLETRYFPATLHGFTSTSYCAVVCIASWLISLKSITPELSGILKMEPALLGA
jgi:hypothetical protein